MMYHYFVDGKKRLGPVDARAIVSLIKDGTITAETPVQLDKWKQPKLASVAFKEHFQLVSAHSTVRPAGDINAAYRSGFGDGLDRGIRWRIFYVTPGRVTIFSLGFLIVLAMGVLSRGNAVAGLFFAALSVAAGVGVTLLFTRDEFRRALLEREERLALRKELDAELVELEKERKLLQRPSDTEVNIRANALAVRYLNENIEWIGVKLTVANYPVMKERLGSVLNSVRAVGYTLTQAELTELGRKFNDEYKAVQRREAEKEEQAAVREKLREEQRAERELRALQEKQRAAEREQAAIAAAIKQALLAANGVHTAEIAEMERRLAEKQAEMDANQRTLSQAELGIKAGHVYVISNIGSFGDGVFKIGMTRRLEPMDRVDELGDASVPFPFDVHMMISCNDAPALENAVHKALTHQRVNKVNLRKEFFTTTREEIERLVAENHGKVEYRVSDDFAEQYFNSKKVTPEMESEIAENFKEIPDIDE